jgi:hypothetical protein
MIPLVCVTQKQRFVNHATWANDDGLYSVLPVGSVDDNVALFGLRASQKAATNRLRLRDMGADVAGIHII